VDKPQLLCFVLLDSEALATRSCVTVATPKLLAANQHHDSCNVPNKSFDASMMLARSMHTTASTLFKGRILLQFW
jgi:hypothetical protein